MPALKPLWCLSLLYGHQYPSHPSAWRHTSRSQRLCPQILVFKVQSVQMSKSQWPGPSCSQNNCHFIPVCAENKAKFCLQFHQLSSVSLRSTQPSVTFFWRTSSTAWSEPYAFLQLQTVKWCHFQPRVRVEIPICEFIFFNDISIPHQWRISEPKVWPEGSDA